MDPRDLALNNGRESYGGSLVGHAERALHDLHNAFFPDPALERLVVDDPENLPDRAAEGEPRRARRERSAGVVWTDFGRRERRIWFSALR